MAFPEFSDRFAVGHPLIDPQHAELFRLLDRLQEGMGQGMRHKELGDLLFQLWDAMVKHFQTEEELMQRSQYPGYLEHKRKHDDLMFSLRNAEAKHRAGDVSLPLTLAMFLKDWLAHHISQEDRRIVDHLRDHAMEE